MVDGLLDFMLGPMRGISAFYFEHQLLFNTIIIAIAVFKLFSKKKKKASS